ncbi:MAG TPA: hypothetical protein VFC07_04195 [Verrucomicrobiae bacterium]|nr:hypothetical protein [Verrucomicrobiae bacterium]
MSNLIHEIAALLEFLGNNPMALLHFLAYACAITLLIAIVTDALLRQRQAVRNGRALAKPPKPRSDLTLRAPHGFELAKARGSSLLLETKAPKH